MKFKTLFLLFFCLSTIHSQITFNKRFNFDFPACVLSSVVVSESCYYTTGIIADSIYPYKSGNIFVKLSLEGEPMWIKTLLDTIQTFEVWDNTLLPTKDGGFLAAGYTFTPEMKGLIIKYNEVGDTVFTKTYLNPHYPEETFIRPRDFKPTPDGGYVLLNAISGLSNLASDFAVVKLDSSFNEEWQNIYGGSLYEFARNLLIDKDSNIYASALRVNFLFTTSQAHILKLDSEGNTIWSYFTPNDLGLRDGANDMVLLENGDLIVASGSSGIKIGSSLIRYEKNVFRLNPNLEIVWDKEFYNTDQPNDDKTTNLIKLANSDEVIVCGTKGDHLNSDDSHVDFGWIAKLSLEGDSIWERKYVYLENTLNAHEFYDIKETPDGGFILCGQSRDRESGAQIPQQGWLLKLDEYGCLVPGCHLIDDVIEAENIQFELKLYPNPVSDFLNVFFRNHSSKMDFSFSISDVSGRVLNTYNYNDKEATLMIPVWDYGAGIYFLRVENKGKVLKTERFIISK